jgi:hypothetical protein
LNSENGCQEKHSLAHAFHDPSTSGSVPAMESCVGTKEVGMTVVRAEFVQPFQNIVAI